MAGIDYSKATLRQREIFAFTSIQAEEARKIVIETCQVSGCVLISTCNRTEIWISETGEKVIDLTKVICELKKVSYSEYTNMFVARSNIKAIRHLLETACGLKSQIWGEDQILAQIKNAIEQARDAGTSDAILEKLFQTAITAAKKVKTKTRLTSYDASVVTRAVEKIKDFFPVLNELECLVIGNGEMGRRMALMLKDNGARVTVTLRKYKHATSLVPQGCKTVEYDQRSAEVKKAQLIVSATLSPHYTITRQGLSGMLAEDNKKRLFVDLAVPRDIEPEVGDYENNTLLDMDSLGITADIHKNNPSLPVACAILDEYVEEFLKWFKTRRYLPLINSIAEAATEKIRINMQDVIESLNLEEKNKNHLESEMSRVTGKMVRSLLFGIKDNIADEIWADCFERMHDGTGTV